MPPWRFPTAPVFQQVTQHHAVCRVVGGVSSLLLHPLLTMIQVSGAEGRQFVSSLRRRTRRASGGGLDCCGGCVRTCRAMLWDRG
ncbi:uncharacterized protein M421DRAFT_150645 [Didymella exigua CBS 183.55]|uniref:Uncharacterized protein n=1 Tax=Didymella exigua CBS 183.55 TaxID=1150837 RepID=A0A6A5RJR4_9PLEO|nr:uncharacterized protein M421DRAFT_150645 [Didymella exigua CBS 183.55]KAF1928605.1 hypothetical protein M421DRAFT_150645 [Didymella exigua CBS 183.55]